MQKRVEELVIVSGAKCDDAILSAVNLAYPGLTSKLSFPIRFKTIQPGATWDDGDFCWSTAAVEHTHDSYAIKLCQTDHSLYYSGDGRASVESAKLMRGCDLVIHEAWSMEPVKPSHSSIEECLKLAHITTPPTMALVHLSRETREELSTRRLPMESPLETLLVFPKDGDSLIL